MKTLKKKKFEKGEGPVTMVYFSILWVPCNIGKSNISVDIYVDGDVLVIRKPLSDTLFFLCMVLWLCLIVQAKQNSTSFSSPLPKALAFLFACKKSAFFYLSVRLLYCQYNLLLSERVVLTFPPNIFLVLEVALVQDFLDLTAFCIVFCTSVDFFSRLVFDPFNFYRG